MENAKRLGVEPVISAQEMSSTDVDHLGIMAYVAWFQHASLGRHKVPVQPAQMPVTFSSPEPPRPQVPLAKQVILSQLMRESLPDNVVSTWILCFYILL